MADPAIEPAWDEVREALKAATKVHGKRDDEKDVVAGVRIQAGPTDEGAVKRELTRKLPGRPTKRGVHNFMVAKIFDDGAYLEADDFKTALLRRP